METAIASRADLFSPPPSAPPADNQEGTSAAPIPYAFDFDIVDVASPPSTLPTTTPNSAAEQQDADAETEKFQFRLFSKSKTAQTVILHKSSHTEPPETLTITTTKADSAALTAEEIKESKGYEDEQIAAARVLHRPVEYYIKKRSVVGEQIRMAAVSGEDVVKGSRQVFWSCRVPWRVTALKLVTAEDKGATVGIVVVDEKKSSKDRGRGGTAPQEKEDPGVEIEKTAESERQICVPASGEPSSGIDKAKRRRPNKKRRICLRKRRAAEAAAAEKREAKKARKKASKAGSSTEGAAAEINVHKRTEEEEKEKRIRMNRLKKARKRQKAKEAKATAE